MYNELSINTIAALATPPGHGALAVIRLSGDDSHAIFAGVIREKGKFEREPARKIGLYDIVGAVDIDNKNVSHKTPPSIIIDEVMAIKYCAPRSFTGEDMVEIFCHGGTVIPRKILDKLFSAGARAAGKGEFSRRALLNGKIDLLKAESIAGLIECQTEKRLKSAQLAYQGKQLESLEDLKRRIIGILSDIESRIEFGEENGFENNISHETLNWRELEQIISELEEELHRGENIRTFDDGMTVAIAGPVNAGKSSLFNELLGFNRSIIHDSPGTTRDIVSERAIFDGVTVKLFDSAGIRETVDVVEQQGVERTFAAIKDAHFILWMTSAAEQLDDVERREILEIVSRETLIKPRFHSSILVIINKIDISRETFLSEKRRFCEDNSLNYVETSLTEKINDKNLFTAITAAIRKNAEDIPAPTLIVNDRHRVIAGLILQDLRDCAENFAQEEVSAHFLKSSLDRMAEFLGYTANDEVLDEVFGKFCIGK